MSNTVGDTLRITREERGLSIEQASAVTRVRVPYLQALEANEPELLPSVVQARGYLRLYAGYLGLPILPLLDAWPDRAPVFEIEQPPVGEPAVIAAGPADIPPTETEPSTTKFVEDGKNISGELEVEPPSLVETEQKSQPMSELPASRSIFIAIGEDLRKRRETISLSIDDVERFTRLRARYIIALEQGSIEELPSLVQGRGMLANYAEFLDLDVDQYLTRFADALQARRLEMLPPDKSGNKASAGRGAGVNEPTVHFPGWRRFITPDLMIGGSLFVLFILLVIWGASRVNDLNSTDIVPTPPSISEVLMNTGASGELTTQETPTLPTATEAAPVNEAASVTDTPAAGNQTVTMVAVSNAPLQLNIVAKLRAWMQVTVDGSVAFQGRTIPGNAYPFTGRDKIELITGDGAALQAVFNQQDLGILGDPGEVIQLIFSKEGVLTPTSQYTLTPTITPRPSLTAKPSPLPPTPTITPLIP